MLGKTPFRFLVLAALFTLLIPLAVNTPGAAADGDDNQFTIPEKAELKYPNLGSMLNQLAARVEEGEATAEDAAGDAPVHRAESVAVTIYLSGNVDAVVRFLEDFGGSPRNVGEDYIEAYVPVSLLGPVSEQTGVIRVREIVPPEPEYGDFTSQGVQAHLSEAWNQAGYSGQGVKVGIIDVGFKDLTSLMGTELPATVQARCYTDIGVFTQDLADCEAVDDVTTSLPECLDYVRDLAARSADHGTIVAESVIDIAPEVTLYIAKPQSRGDLRDATDWMASEGVSVINYSVSWTFDGPGDGTSPLSASPLNTVDRAVANDIIWVNSAGNSAQETWFGGYSDPDDDKLINFISGNYEVNSLPLRACRRYRVQLRWEDDWDGASTDLDLYLYHIPSGTFTTDYSEDEQSGQSGHVPFETFFFRSRVNSDDFGIVVVHHGGDVPDWIQLAVWAVDPIQHHTGSGSITNPAESANPGMLAVGAAPWYDVNTIEPYSSRGPTPDGRVKPDIVGADCGETALSPLNQRQRGFCGTSQAAPHVAGLAVLVRQRFPDYTPAQVASYLKDHAQQRETPDPNNTWGHGFAKLPSLSECSDAVPSVASNPGLVADCEALLAARDTLAGSGTLNWSGSTAIAAWDGVTLSGSPLRVTSLVLSDSQLTGTIPPELGNLNNLERLNLTRNQLTGDIPPELSLLTNLQLLALGGNQSTGPIPTWLGSLAKLQELQLWGNQFTGAIPPELGNLPGLVKLGLSENQLSGPVPTWMGSLADLEELYLSQNQLSGAIPSELGSLTNLEILALGGNQLSGQIPSQLASLTNLQRLSLYDNQLSGPVPTWLGRLVNLQELYLSQNQLTGVIPTELESLVNLQELYLSQNQLTGVIPTELESLVNLEQLVLWGNHLTGVISPGLSNLTNLEVLSLSNNQLTGVIPTELGILTNLEILALGGNQLSGPVPTWMGSLADLQELYLSQNQLSGAIPTELGSLSKLQVLYLWGNQLTGPIPVGLGTLNNLRELSLGGNQLTGPIPTWLGSLAKLQELQLWGNQFTGAIPPELGNLPGLVKLGLSENQLSGPVPTWMGSLADLEELYLSQNQLSGAIPSELGSLTNLEILALGGNQLSGQIPSQLASLTNLQRLSLYDNQLSGPVPTWLGRLVNLQELYLSQNQLTGVIPTELESLVNLQELYLSQNQLTGTIPSELGSLTNLQQLSLSNNQLSGPVPIWLGSLTNLERLHISRNQLTGMIPAELGSLTNLQRLSLNDNQLTGMIPAELGSLTNLQWLLLGGNQLSGRIPAELGSLTNLELLFLGGNQLTGPIPASLGSLSNLESLNLSSNQLTGPIPASLGGLANLERLSLSQNMLTGCVPEAWRDIAESDVLELGLPFCAVSLGTAPVFSDSEGNPITEAVRSVVETTAAGENVGAPVTAMDADNDTLTYSLGGTDMASFDIDPSTGQIMVGAGTMLDYETKASYMVTITATDPDSASDMITVPITVTNEEETGEVTLWAGMDALTMAPQVGDTITGAVMDPDGGVTGETWQWSRTMDDMDSRDMDSWVDIEDATDDEYTVMEGDTGYYLRVMATYTDAVGTDTAMEYSMPTIMVTAEDLGTLGSRYDTDNNRLIDKEEAIAAVRDYFDDRLTKEETIEIIRLYFTSSS